MADVDGRDPLAELGRTVQIDETSVGGRAKREKCGGDPTANKATVSGMMEVAGELVEISDITGLLESAHGYAP